MAKKASPTTTPPVAPVGGILSVNGTVVSALKGVVLNVTALDDDTVNYIPKPGENNPYMTGMAGGGQISNYNWAPTISGNATQYLQLMQWCDDLLLKHIFGGYNKMNGGVWGHVYPHSIVQMIGAMGAQSYMHRSFATDSLQHYNQPLVGACTYNVPDANTDDFLHVALSLILLIIGLHIDAITALAASDPWIVPCIATSLGAKTRMMAVVNMMQGHVAAAAPREVAIPAPLVYSYITQNYAPSCQGAPSFGTAIPPLKVTNTVKQPGSDRVTGVTVSVDPKLQSQGQLFLTWLGPWGAIPSSPVGPDGSAVVPTSLYGHVWVVLTNKEVTSMKDLAQAAVAGPELVWITQP